MQRAFKMLHANLSRKRRKNAFSTSSHWLHDLISIWSPRRADEAVCQPLRNLPASVRPTKHPVSQTGVHCEPATSSTAPEWCGLKGQSCRTRDLAAQWGGYPGIQPFTGGLCAHWWTVQSWKHAAKPTGGLFLCGTATVMFIKQNRDKMLPVNSSEGLLFWKGRNLVYIGFLCSHFLCCQASGWWMSPF